MKLSPTFAALFAVVAGTAVSASILKAPKAAEEIHADAAGNLVWADNDADSSNVVPSLTRPDFTSHHVSTLESEIMDGFAHFEEQLTQPLEDLIHSIDSKLHSATHAAGKWLKDAQSVWKAGIEYERFQHTSFPEYALRVTKDANSTICDSKAKQISGYLDISESKHLWFALFESRDNPKKDPLQLWLNGGPGCSSSTGRERNFLVFVAVSTSTDRLRLGPCRIANGGESVVDNPHSWNNRANLLFLDQPVNVGYSYGDEDVNNTPVAAQDVYAFLQLFLQRFDQYAKLPFHVSGESYAGTYIPRIGSVIHQKNKELKKRGGVSAMGTGPVHINMESLFIGNGLTDPLAQFHATPTFLCDKEINPYALFKNDSSTCVNLRSKAQTCASLISACYKYNNRLTCLPAAISCWSGLYSDAQQSGKNLYDLRRDCNRDPDKDGPLCYREMEWMEVFMNKPEVKKAFGASSDVKFQSCNTQINQAFLFQGDGMHNSAALLPELIDDGIRVGIYAGMTDLMCHWYGNEQWTSALKHNLSSEYAKEPEKEWKGKDGKTAGYVRAVGKGGFGSWAWIKIPEAGHMVPFDKSEVALELVEAWRDNKALV